MNIYIGWPVEVSDMQWPCPNGFHVPLQSEWQYIYDAGVSLGAWTSSWGNNISTYLKLPMAGYRDYSSLSLGGRGSNGNYWSSTPYGTNYAYPLFFNSSNISLLSNSFRSYGFSVRCVKDSPTTPTSSWTVLYQGSWSAWIFHNPTDWLISISSDWTTWYTIMDKNLWATTVYNYWDTLTEANCGKIYQRGNNYWFSWDANYDVSQISKSSTQVNVTWYWPWNYYESSTWITARPWQSSASDWTNLRWWVTQWTSLKSVEVKNIYIGDGRIYKWEYIEYRMTADSSGNLYAPLSWWNSSWWQRDCAYSWKISVDWWTETTYSWTWSHGWLITLSWYIADSSYTIKIRPTTESYQRARAYAWYATSKRTLLTEVIYDSSYMGYAVSATDTGNYFRGYQYDSCLKLTNVAKEYMPNTVTTIWNSFRTTQYNNCPLITLPAEEVLSDSVTSIWTNFRTGQYFECTNITNSPVEVLPNSVTSIWMNFRRTQYYKCTSLTEIKWWNDLSIWWNYYRFQQYYDCTSNKTVKVLSNVWYSSHNQDVLNNTYVTSVSVPSAYLTNFKNSSNYPWVWITDSKFIWY